MQILILSFLAFQAVSQSISPIDTTCFYIDTITSEDGIIIPCDSSGENLVRNGYFYLTFYDNEKFFISELYIGKFNNGEICCEMDSGYFGKYKTNSKGELIIRYVRKVKWGRFYDESIIKYKIIVEEDKIVIDKYLSGQGLFRIWKKTDGKNRAVYYKYCP